MAEKHFGWYSPAVFVPHFSFDFDNGGNMECFVYFKMRT